MSTSGSTDFNVTTLQIINDALLLNNAIDKWNPLDANDRDICLRFLNYITKNIAKDANLWVMTDVTHTLTPGTESYTVGTGLNINTARPLKLKHCRRRDSNGTDIAVDVVSRQDYMEQPTKSTQSSVLMTYYDPQRDNGVLYVWPTGDSGNKTLILTFQRPIQDFDNNGDNPDFPQEWFIWLPAALAYVISPIYSGVARDDLLQMAVGFGAPLEAFDSQQVSVNFKPDIR